MTDIQLNKTDFEYCFLIDEVYNNHSQKRMALDKITKLIKTGYVHLVPLSQFFRKKNEGSTIICFSFLQKVEIFELKMEEDYIRMVCLQTFDCNFHKLQNELDLVNFLKQTYKELSDYEHAVDVDEYLCALSNQSFDYIELRKFAVKINLAIQKSKNNYEIAFEGILKDTLKLFWSEFGQNIFELEKPEFNFKQTTSFSIWDTSQTQNIVLNMNKSQIFEVKIPVLHIDKNENEINRINFLRLDQNNVQHLITDSFEEIIL